MVPRVPYRLNARAGSIVASREQTVNSLQVGVFEESFENFFAAASTTPAKAIHKFQEMSSVQSLPSEVHNVARRLAHAANPHFMRVCCRNWGEIDPPPG